MNGIFPLYKEKGFTSFDAVAVLRGILHERKIGHAGTLDPDAEGVLVILTGSSAKLSDALSGSDKEYEAVLHLGITTDTQDMTGTVLSDVPVTQSEEEIRAAVLSFIGTYEQVPPMYSAKKVGGKKLYDLARAGKEVERKPVPVSIRSITILSVDLPYVRFRVRCGKGTYIRALCADIGDKLGCGAAMESLVRTECCGYQLGDALTLAMVREKAAAGDFGFLRSAASYYEAYPALTVTGGEALKRLQNGNPIPAPEKPTSEYIRVYDPENVFVGVFRFDQKTNLLRPYKLFWEGK